MSTDTNDKREGSSSGGSKRARQPISTGREYGAISRRASPPPNASSKRAMIEQALAVSPKRYKHDGKLPYPALGDDAWTYATGEMVHSEDAQAREREARRIDEATALYGSLRAAGMRDSLASAVATQVCDSALRVLNRNMPLRDFVEAFGRHELKIEGPDDCIDLRATPIGDKRDPTEQEKAHADRLGADYLERTWPLAQWRNAQRGAEWQRRERISASVGPHVVAAAAEASKEDIDSIFERVENMSEQEHLSLIQNMSNNIRAAQATDERKRFCAIITCYHSMEGSKKRGTARSPAGLAWSIAEGERGDVVLCTTHAREQQAMRGLGLSAQRTQDLLAQTHRFEHDVLTSITAYGHELEDPACKSLFGVGSQWVPQRPFPGADCEICGRRASAVRHGDPLGRYWFTCSDCFQSRRSIREQIEYEGQWRDCKDFGTAADKHFELVSRPCARHCGRLTYRSEDGEELPFMSENLQPLCLRCFTIQAGFVYVQHSRPPLDIVSKALDCMMQQLPGDSDEIEVARFFFAVLYDKAITGGLLFRPRPFLVAMAAEQEKRDGRAKRDGAKALDLLARGLKRI